MKGLALIAFSVLLLVPVGAQQAFADDLTDPPWGGPSATNAVEYAFRDQGATDDCDSSDPTGTFDIISRIGPSIYDVSNLVPPGVIENVVSVPNFKDPLLFKRIQIEQTFCPRNPSADPADIGSIARITGSDTESGVVCLPGDKGEPQTGLAGQTAGSTYFVQDGNCIPNPDSELIILGFNSADWALIQVVVNTISEGEASAVGGDFIGIDTTMILAAGAQYTVAWMIPVLVSAIGIGIVIARKF